MFSGTTYDPTQDHDRLTTQLNRVFDKMKGGQWHTIDELTAYSGGTPQAVIARIRDFRKERFGGHTVERERVKAGLWRYKLILRRDLLEAA